MSWTDRWTDRRMDGRTDGRTDRRTEPLIELRDQVHTPEFLALWQFVFGFELRNLLRSHVIDLVFRLRNDGRDHLKFETPTKDKTVMK